MRSGTAHRGTGLDCLSQEREKGRVFAPGSRLLCVSPGNDLRRLLHEQDRNCRLAIHWEHVAARVSRLPATAGAGLSGKPPFRLSMLAKGEQDKSVRWTPSPP